MARNYAALPHEYLREMGSLCDAEFGRLCRALLQYSMDGTPIALRGNERFYAERVMMQEDRFQQNYTITADLSAARSDAGQRGAAARWQNGKSMANDGKPILPYGKNGKNGKTNTNTETNIYPPTEEKEKGTIVPQKKVSTFRRPTVSEVAAYCAERGNGVDPEAFVAFYDSKGWVVGKSPMKSWKAAVVTWEKADKARGGRSTPLRGTVDKMAVLRGLHDEYAEGDAV